VINLLLHEACCRYYMPICSEAQLWYDLEGNEEEAL
jgi:hypothetical protein